MMVARMCWHFTMDDTKAGYKDSFNIRHINLVRGEHIEDEEHTEAACYRSKSEAITALMDRMERFVEIKSRK